MFYSFVTNARECVVKNGLFKWSTQMGNPMQVTNEGKTPEIGNIKIQKLHIGINYFAKNSRIEQGNLNNRVDSTGYVHSME
jgi:hypothetical protein